MKYKLLIFLPILFLLLFGTSSADYLTTESGDILSTEGGDRLLLEQEIMGLSGISATGSVGSLTITAGLALFDHNGNPVTLYDRNGNIVNLITR